jgi:Fe-S-cluster containining protein
MNRERNVALALQRFDQEWAGEVAREKIVSTCSKGCSACCSEPVYCSKLEARLTLRYLPDAERPGVIERTRAWLTQAKATDILDIAEPHVMDYLACGLVCPFLKDKLCLVYPNRPFGCRSHCAVGPAIKCSTDRLHQTYARSPKLIAVTGAVIFSQQSEGDHLGVWLSRLLLQAPVQSEAHVSVDDLRGS